MNNFGTILKREFSSYFNSPIGYIYIIVFLLITAGLYMSTFFLVGQANMRGYFAVMPLFLSVFIPAITMRLWAEERKLGTISLLLSFPIRSGALVLGKFAAALLFYLTALACTVTIPIVLGLVGNPDWGPVLVGYFGSALMGCLFLAIGMFVSALFKDQIAAFILSILICFGMSMLGAEFVAAFIDGWVGGLGTALQKALGVLNHASDFERGVVDWGNVFFFLSFTAILLVLNTFTLDSKIKLRSTGRFYVSVVFLLGIGFVLNLIVSDMRLGRLDFTEGQIYTVSPATARILSKLQVPVEVNYYVSEKGKMPSALKDIRRDVEDKLSDLARLSSNFTYHVYNPLADAGKLEDLEKKGIVPFQARSIERDSLDIKQVYSAISITYLDKQTEVLPQIVPQNLGALEYELVSNIYRMTLENIPRLTMVAHIETADPRYNDPRMRSLLMKLGQAPPEMRDDYQGGMQLLRKEGYQVSRVALTKEEPMLNDTNTLLVIEPQTLNDRQIYEIQRFLAQGGNVIVAAQPYTFNYSPTRGGDLEIQPVQAPAAVNKLLEPYGVQLDSDILLDEEMEILNVTVPKRIGGLFNAMVSMPVKAPVQIRIPAAGLNPDTSITNRIGALLYLWGGALKLQQSVLDQQQIKLVTLAESSSASWTIPFQQAPLGPEDMSPGDRKTMGPKPLAVYLEGQFPDTFEGKDVPPWPKAHTPDAPQAAEDEEKPGPAPAIEKKPGHLIVVGCSQMFTNNALGALDNRLFFQNMADGLTLSEDLIGIRAKSQSVRYIENVTAGENLFYRFLAVALVPLALAIMGISRFAMRRRRRERYEKSIASSAVGSLT